MSVKFTSHKSEVIDAKNRAVEAALTEIGLTAERFAKEKISEPKAHADGSVRPSVVTGELRRSIDFEVKENEEAVYVGSNISYAVFVETGTSRSQAYPFLRPAVEEHLSDFKEIAEKHLKGG